MPSLIPSPLWPGKRKDESTPATDQPLVRNGVRIGDSFADAFGMTATGIIVTAPAMKWAMHAAMAMTGGGCAAGIDRELPAAETPDGRPGVRVLLFGNSPADIEEQLNICVSLYVLTCPGTACYAGLDSETRIKLGAGLRRFGDGHQSSKVIGGRRYWRVPVMDGEFVCEDTTGVTTDAVGGGSLLVMGRTVAETLNAVEAAAEAIKKVPGVIMPFPGGAVRSGSKAGSIYKALAISTDDAYCPTLRGKVKTALDPDIGAVEQIVIDGLTSDAAGTAMRAAVAALTGIGARGGVLRIGAGNHGGEGQFHYHLRDLLP